jgi:sodium-dependent dicarboxylate transporter 2/3/5
MAGLMAVTAFLSMWINNSAATSIMIPAAVAIIDEFQQHEQEMQERSAIPRNSGNANRRKSKDILPMESTSKNLRIRII